MLPIVLLLLCAATSLRLGVLSCESQQVDNPLIYVDSELGRNDTRCWYEGCGFPCMTLDFAVEGIQNTSNSTRHPWIYLQEGHYTLSHTVSFDGVGSEIMDVGILGNSTSDHSSPPVVVNCTAVESSLGFAFLNINNVAIEHIWFYGCGAIQNSTSQDLNSTHGFQLFQAGLYFVLCKDVFLSHVWVTDSPGIGVVMYATVGENSIFSCNFSNNVFPEHQSPAYPGGGGFYLEFPYCLPGNISGCNESSVPLDFVANSSYDFTDCYFTQNKAGILDKEDTFILPHKREHSSFGRGGGLSVFFKGEAQNNIITVNHSLFYNNQALWGGGLFIEFQDNSRNNVFQMLSSSLHNNSCPYNVFKKEGTGGGGMRIGYVFFGNLHVHDNRMVFDGCDFCGNSAYWGGGVSYYVAREQLVTSATNTLCFKNCQWYYNKGRLGAAIDLSAWHPVSSGLLSPVNFTDTTISLHQNLSNLQSPGTIVGLGAMYTDSIPIVFNGYANFTFNEHTALAAISTSIEFNKSSHAHFYHNSGRDGGAFALFGSSFIRTYDETVLSFVNNSARQKGGAIYSEIAGDHELISSRNCFIRFEDIVVSPQNWTSEFVFTNNTAHDKPNSIFTTTILPCIWGGSFGPSQADPSEIFCWNENWIYNGSSSNCSDQIETALGTFNLSTYSMEIIPGQRKNLGISMYDDFSRDASENMVLTAHVASGVDTDVAKLDDGWKYISDDTVKLFGIPNNTVNLDLYTLYPRVIYTTATVKIIPCPPGYVPTPTIRSVHNSTECVCKAYNNFIKCLDSYRSRLQRSGTWIGSYTNTSRAVAGNSPYTYNVNISVDLPTDLLELNDYLCSNRSQGILCSKCISGHGHAINSNIFKCVKCHRSDRKLSWLFFILTEILPVAIIFFILVIFNISLTSGPANAFIFFCQMITTSVALYTSNIPPYDNFRKVYMTIYGVWNLHFFDAILPHYCLNTHMNVAAMIALKYIVAVFPLLLILVVYSIIWMYNRGTQPVTVLCRPIHYCFARFRSRWDLRRSITDVIAAFLLLSYTKFIIVSIQLLSPSNLFDENDAVFKTVLYYDGSIGYFSKEHTPYVIAAVFVLVVFVIFPPLLLLAYPFKIFHKFLTCCTCNRCQLGGRTQLFLYTFYGCYKDGTDPGTRDWRCFAGLYFVLRIIFVVTGHVTYFFYPHWGLQYTLQQLVCTVGLLLFALARPYKNDFYNGVDIAIFGIFACINAVSNFNFYLGDNYKPSPWIFGIVYLLIWCPLIYMLLYLFNHFRKSYDLFSRFSHFKFWKRETPANLTLNDISDDSFIRLVDNREPASLQASYQQRHTHQPAEGDDRGTETTSLLTPGSPATNINVATGVYYSGSATTNVATGVYYSSSPQEPVMEDMHCQADPDQ